jgi:mono/diheme cytochrome c family protein
MKRAASIACLSVLAAVAALLIGCDGAHGHPGQGPSVVRPEEVLDFGVLYKTNCAACHGAKGSGGGAAALGNPTYLALAGEDVLRTVTANGVHGKLMPRFARRMGGDLTDQQIDAIVHGMLQTWGKPGTATQNMPPYKTEVTGNVDRGREEFGAFCASCHGPNGEGNLKAVGPDKTKVRTTRPMGSIVDEAYLDLVSDQSLRSTVIAGRPDLGMPDWRGHGAAPLTDEQTTDILAWIASKRVKNPGQPYSAQISPKQ